MSIPMSLARATFTVSITDEERALAQEVRKDFESLLARHKELIRLVEVLNDGVEDVVDFRAIGESILKFRIKLRDEFNDLIKAVSQTLGEYPDAFKDIGYKQIRDIYIEYINRCHEGMTELLAIMNKYSEDNFGSELSAATYNLIKYLESAHDSLKNEWIEHIDYDIIGKVKIG